MHGDFDTEREKIMVVDDEPFIRELIQRVFQKNGYSVTVAGGGKECLDFLKVEKPDLVLLDIMMPDMDGFQVCENIKSNGETKDIPVVFVSVKNGEMDIVRAIELGASDYFTKPITNQLLLTKVKQILKESKYQKKMYKEYNSLKAKISNIEDKYQNINFESPKPINEKPVIKPPSKPREERVIGPINGAALVEYEPREDFYLALESISRGIIEENKSVLVMASQPTTNNFHTGFSSEIQDDKMKIIEVVDQLNVDESQDAEFIQFSLSEVVHNSIIWKYIPENSLMIFTPLSDILSKYGVKMTYNFLKNASEALEKRNVKLIATLNKKTGDENTISGIESLFGNIFEVRDGQLKKLVY